MGLSLRLKLASFNLLFATYKSISSSISSPNLLVAKKYFFTSSLVVLSTSFKISVLWKVYTIEPILVKRLNKIARKIVQSFCFLFLMNSVAR